MGFSYWSVRKDTYFDGHERDDVKAYRNNVFLPQWKEHSARFVEFAEDGKWEKPQLPDGILPLVLITHDEST